jgi:hypothetical protein
VYKQGKRKLQFQQTVFLELISSRDTTNFSVETLLVSYQGLRSKVRWKDNVEDDIRKTDVVNNPESRAPQGWREESN